MSRRTKRKMQAELAGLRELNRQLVERLAAASYVLSRAAERNGLVHEVMELRRQLGLEARLDIVPTTVVVPLLATADKSKITNKICEKGCL